MTEVVSANGESLTSVEETSSEVVGKNSVESTEASTEESKVEVSAEFMNGDSPPLDDEDTPVDQIQHNLDELSCSGTAINELEVQLMQHKKLYHQTLTEGRQRVDYLAKKLNSHIMKSEPFVIMWRRAKEVQEKSNRAAARYDKANSQHTAAKEMIRVAESQLEERLLEAQSREDSPSSPSPLDAAWQEMLNHATAKVVLTEKERRDSELEHRKVLEECTRVMEEYRATEKKLRTHITKSRPYYEARFKTNQQLMNIKKTVKELEERISKHKHTYSASLRRLDLLSTEMHMRRGTLDSDHLSKYGRNQRQVLSTGSSPVLHRNGHRVGGREDVVSVDSLQWSETGGYGGSVDSLPSLNTEDPDSNDRQLKSLSSSQSSSSQTSHLESPPLPLMPSTSEATPPPLRATPPAVFVSPSNATPHLSSSVPQAHDTPNTPTTPTPSSHSYAVTSSVTTPTSSVISHPVIVSTSSSPQVTPQSTMASSSLDSSPSCSASSSKSSTTLSPSPICGAEHQGSVEAEQSVEETARELVEKSVLKALSQIHTTAH